MIPFFYRCCTHTSTIGFMILQSTVVDFVAPFLTLCLHQELPFSRIQMCSFNYSKLCRIMVWLLKMCVCVCVAFYGVGWIVFTWKVCGLYLAFFCVPGSKLRACFCIFDECTLVSPWWGLRRPEPIFVPISVVLYLVCMYVQLQCNTYVSLINIDQLYLCYASNKAKGWPL